MCLASAVGGTARGVDMMYSRNSYGHLAAMPLALAGVPVFALVLDIDSDRALVLALARG